jgi:hypothetical protein
VKESTPRDKGIEDDVAHQVSRPELFQCITLVVAHIQDQGKKEVQYFCRMTS